MDRRPNIILIQADQHRADTLGINGHPIVETPHLDGLAKEGTNFTHAFCPIPLCGPSRCSMVTGQWAHNHGALSNWDCSALFRPIADEIPTYARALREAGYHLSYLAKWHVDPDRGPDFFGFHIARAEYAFEEEYLTWRKEEGLPDRPISDTWFTACDAHFGFTDKGIIPEQSRLGWAAGQAVKELEACAAQDKPFFFTWQPPEPHFPCVVPEPYASMYKPEDIPPWPGFADPLKNKPYIQAQMRRTWNANGWKWSEWAPSAAHYLGEVSLLDAQIGRVLDAVDRLGLKDNTIVIYTADHGDMTGSHGMLDKHCVMYDDIVRVPLIIRWPGLEGSGHTSNAFVSHALDLAATFCEAGGAKTPDSFDGESLIPVLKGEPGNREEIFSEYFGYQFGLYLQKMVRDRQFKYVWNATAEDELYDLGNDPGEITNLAQNKSFASELKRLRGRLAHWMESTNDPCLQHWTKAQLRDGRSV
ncbi:sulfatase-like hydrolase/transferase [Planctomycetota bacterium]